YYVLELSSFQLDDMYEFKADVAVLLNITPDHLDRYDYSFEKRDLTKGKDIPVAFTSLIEKVQRLLPADQKDIAELLVTEYPVGSVINWHRDAPPFDVIAGISLMTDCTFRLRPLEKAKQNRYAIISFPVHRRSLYIMQGEARSNWQHSISPVKKVRYSITLRTLRK
ncbi:MAG: alpha-ketoglutarate-dependent dioxygenase AlkB, partial [Flavisolibacter sp.]